MNLSYPLNDRFQKINQGQPVRIEQLPAILLIPNGKLAECMVAYLEKQLKTDRIDETIWNQLYAILTTRSTQHNLPLPKERLIDLFFCMMGLEDSSENVPNSKILEILEEIFSILDARGAAIYFMNRIIDDTSDQTQRVGYVLNKIHQTLPQLQDALELHFIELKNIARTAIASKILNHEFLFLLRLRPQIKKHMQLLYNTIDSGTSFNRLAWNVLGYGGPTLLLIHTDKKALFNGVQWPIIFGAYNPQPWTDGLKFQSDSSVFLFSLSPIYRIFQTQQGEQNYAYLNTKNIDKSKFKVGLGFGGNSEHTSFRIWIDDEIETRSKVSSEDTTFQPGYLAGETEGKISILYLEIWGLGGQEAIDAQNQYRQERLEELERMRKVDKKQFFSGFDQQMFFEKAFAHKANVREDCID